MKTILIFLSLAFFTLNVSECEGSSTDTPSDSAERRIIVTTILATNPSNQSSLETPKKKNWHLEIGGSYSDFDHGSDIWKSFDLRLRYSGFEKITPFGSISRLSRSAGSQYAYGFGSYINVSPKFYMITGISGAPVRDPDVIFSPRFRLDLAGFYSIPIVEGFVLSAGITHFPEHKGQSGQIISLGGIYYGRIILIGALNYNISQPGHMTSWSGQAGFMYGHQGKYYIGGGVNIGKVSYQLALTTPLDVSYKSRGVHLQYSRWLGKSWGINTRIDYSQYVVGEIDLVGVTISLFFEF